MRPTSTSTDTFSSANSANQSSQSEPNPGECQPHALALSYYGGGPGAGNDVGTVVIANTSGSACTIAGPVRLVGLSAAGRPDTNDISAAVAPNMVLTAHGTFPAVGYGFPAGLTDAALTLIAEYRDDPPGGGLCTAHEVIPASWRLTFPDGIRRTVTNRGDHPAYPHFGSLITCRGRLGTSTTISRAFPT
jgi:hypothetical protein